MKHLVSYLGLLLAGGLVAAPAFAQSPPATSPNNMTWMAGDSTLNLPPVYGTQGMSAAANTPGSREGAAMASLPGKLYLFGGQVNPNTTAARLTNDLWVYDSATTRWTWLKGDSTIVNGGVGNFGTKGVAAAANVPSIRYYQMLTSSNGRVYLFGGLGKSSVATGNNSSGDLSDLWAYNPATNQWAWIQGDSLANQPGAYGQQNIGSSTTKPGGRESGAFVALNGNLYLFGGSGYGAYNGAFSPIGLLNDLWRYETSTSKWIWVKGSSQVDQNGIYGTKGVAAASSNPGGRYLLNLTTANGQLYLYGGTGYDGNGSQNGLGDLWRYEPGTNKWAWLNGSSASGIQAGMVNYGTQGVASANNWPGVRENATFKAQGNRLFLVGGSSVSPNNAGEKNDVWAFDLSSGQWVWLKGSNTFNQTAVFGAKLTPASTNRIGARRNVLSAFLGNQLYLFGGYGNASSSTMGYLSDMWRYDIPTAATAPLASPTVQASAIVASNATATSVKLTLTKGTGQKRLIVVRQGAYNALYLPYNDTLYTPNAAFGAGKQVYAGSYSVYADTGRTVTVTGLTAQNSYTATVFEYAENGTQRTYLTSPLATASFYTTVASPYAAEPTVQTSSLTISNVFTTSFKVNWVNGNGALRTVIVSTSPITSANRPVDGAVYTPNVSYTSTASSSIGGAKVVYQATSTSVSVMGLTPGTPYYVAAFEFNGSSTTNRNYLTSAYPTATATTALPPITTPTVQASALQGSNMATTSATLTLTKGNGQKRLIVLRQAAMYGNNPLPLNDTIYTASPMFGQGKTLGGGVYVVYADTGNTVNITGLMPSTIYSAVAFEYNAMGSQRRYLTASFAPFMFYTAGNALATEPTMQVSSFTATAASTTQLQLNWANGNGALRTVLVSTSPITAANLPVDGAAYTSNASFTSTASSSIGGAKVVYQATGTTVMVGNLTPGTTYYAAAFEYNGTGNTNRNYITSAYPTASATLPAFSPEPTAIGTASISNIGKTSLKVNWANGNGNNRIVVLSSTPITAANYPVDGNMYTNTSVIGGAKVVYAGMANSILVGYLTANTVYYAAVFEYNGTGASANYLTSSFATITATTLMPRLDGQSDAMPLLAYPNPFTTSATVMPAQTGMLTLCDAQGRILETVNAMQGQPVQLGAGLAPGMYLLRCGTEVLQVVKGQ